jgi:uncharacterized membrane protein YhaH (DUF805 family)
MNWYLNVLKKYVVFDGRARRQEYWMFALFNFIIYVVLSILWRAADSSLFLILIYLYGLAVLLPVLGVTWRRLHDTNRSGGWFFISLVPFIGGIWLLVLLVLPGTTGPNRFGPDPKAIAQYA